MAEAHRHVTRVGWQQPCFHLPRQPQASHMPWTNTITLESGTTSTCKVRTIVLQGYCSRNDPMCTQNNFISVIRGSHLKAKQQCVGVVTHIQVKDGTMCSAALQQSHLPMLCSRISLSYIIHWQARSRRKSRGATKARERIWEAEGLQHKGTMAAVQRSVTLTLLHFFCQAAAQLSKSLDLSLSWPLRDNTKCSCSLPTKYHWAFYKNSTSCLHIRIQWDNIDRNNENFETLPLYKLFPRATVDLSSSKGGVFTW